MIISLFRSRRPPSGNQHSYLLKSQYGKVSILRLRNGVSQLHLETDETI
jgi:hypothetical protein